MNYAGFWLRAAAFILDYIIMIPLFFGPTYFLGKHTHAFYAYMVVPSFLFNVWFNVYIVKRFGGTPGKRLLGLSVTMQDGSPINYGSAVVRYCVELTLYTASSVGMAIAALKIPETTYVSLSISERGRMINYFEPSWSNAATLLFVCWIFVGMAVIVFNKRKRSMHDLMAGTVVMKVAKNAN